MATSRENSQFARRPRSNTAQSSFKAPSTHVAPLALADSTVLHAWVHDIKDNQSVIFNQSWWPGVAEGDCLRMLSSNTEDPEAAFLFVVPKDEGCPKPQLQISLPRPIAEALSLRNNGEITLTKVDKGSWNAGFVELFFQDQYLGRNDMWRLGKYLSGQCIYKNQEISFVGGIAAKIQNIYINGNKVSSARMATSTKMIYRSFSAKITIFIQVCRELWEFAGDGERYNEKIVHSFLPALFGKWREAGTNHTVTIVLISRVFYDESEIDYASGPLRRDERGCWYKDFFKVITDLEVLHEWKPTLVSLKNSFWDFQRDILLTHHYHQTTKESGVCDPDQARLVGKISYAQDGPILEALNLGLNPTETHYIDRSLNLTGATTILISPGTGHFQVNKKLLRLTTTRMLDQGFVLDLILLTKQPLHQSPIFSFLGVDPFSNPKLEKERHMIDPLVLDPLWGGGDDSSADARQKKLFWWEPFWISTTFWDRQMDQPFRQDRFVARAKMHEIQMLGLLEQDVLSSIEVPYMEKLDGTDDSSFTTKAEADKFDMDAFTLTINYDVSTAVLRQSGLNSNSIPSGFNAEKRTSQRRSTIGLIGTIEESPRIPVKKELPSEESATKNSAAITRRDSSSQLSVHSTHSDKSTASRAPSLLNRGSFASKLTPSWLFNPFRTGAAEPQLTQVSASASPSARSAAKLAPPTAAANLSRKPQSPIKMPAPSGPTVAAFTPPVPAIAIKSRLPIRPGKTPEDEISPSPRGHQSRRSPINTPPRDEVVGSSKRRSIISGSGLARSFPSSVSPSTIINPTRPQSTVAYPQAALARRWQHIYPLPVYKNDFKWRSIVTPGCLPLSVEHFPSSAELESSYKETSYEFIIDPPEMKSFLVKPPMSKGTGEDLRRAWALVVMRGMAAVRLAQGFQFILRSPTEHTEDLTVAFRRTKSFTGNEALEERPAGAAEVLSTTTDPIYLSMTNEIHRIEYNGEVITVKRYVRRLSAQEQHPYEYQCLIWPKLGEGYTELKTKFRSDALQNYGWNRLDMLIAGYEHHFNESLKYWRTRFIVIPTAERPHVRVGPTGEELNDEEARILGIEKLAEQFTKLRWQPTDERINHPAPPVRFLPTTLDPALSVLDGSLMDQLDQIHAQGPLRKKINSQREISEMSLGAIAKAMREEDGVPIAFYQWHRSQYPDSFIGYDFVSWLVREFRDVSTRAQATEWGVKLQEQGLFEHCRGRHTFLDGHYYYRLKGEYSVHSTPKNWFRRGLEEGGMRAPYRSLNSYRPQPKATGTPGKKTKKSVILSQTMVIDIDPHKRSDQAETVILHHDIIHNPATVFHFELQWIGTTARCIEDQLRVWSRAIDRYGLKLVEAYVTQISDIRDRNAFQSCFPMPLAIPPPDIPDLDKRVPDGTQTAKYFEYALLQAFDFILDVEAKNLYPSDIEPSYSYRRSEYVYSQFVHRTGVAFIQVLDDGKGFLFLTNRLMGPGRMGSAASNVKDHSKKDPPAIAADKIRAEMAKFCLDEEKLRLFYDEQVARLLSPICTPEEPPPLSI